MSTSNVQDERIRKLNKLRAEKSKIVRTQEYDNPAGKVLVFNAAKSDPEFAGRFGKVCKYVVHDPEYNTERTVMASAMSYVDAVETVLSQKPFGQDVRIRVKRTGTGSDTRYSAEAA